MLSCWNLCSIFSRNNAGSPSFPLNSLNFNRSCNKLPARPYIYSVKNLKFNALAKLYENEVFSLALYLLRDRSEAEDMTQEVYIKLWENLAQVEFSRARLWLMRVTRNGCLDRLRRHTLENNFAQRTVADEPAQGPVDTLVREQRRTLVREAIGGMEEPFRSLLILRDIHQHSYHDIANVLELSLDQVRVYLYRARQQLKTRLDATAI